MKTLLNIVLALALCASCVVQDTLISSWDGGGRPVGRRKVTQFLYGKVTTTSEIFQESFISNLDIGAKAFFQMFTTLVTAYVAGAVQKIAEINRGLAASGASKVQIAKINKAAETEALRITSGNKTQLLNANPQAVAPGATTLNAP